MVYIADYEYPPTPAELKAATPSRDIFDETMSTLSTNPAVNAMLISGAWSKFRFRHIGVDDVDVFVQCLQDRINDAWVWYSRVVDTLIDTETISLNDSESVVDVIGTNDTVSNNTSHSTGSNDLTHESLPVTPVNGISYLDSKDHSGSVNDGDVDGTINNDTTGKTTATGGSGLKIERLNKLTDELQRANNKFIKELESLFMTMG